MAKWTLKSAAYIYHYFKAFKLTFGMQRWLSQVKSQELGQACTGGSTEGSLTQVFPSDCSFSPYGQPQRAMIPVDDVELSGIGKHSFWQPPASLLELV